MAVETQAPEATSAVLGSDEPATLLATFYGDRKNAGIPELHLRLYRLLADEPEATTAPPTWTEPVSSEVRLLRIFPASPASQDTVILQLGLDATRPVRDAWAVLRHRLEALLDDDVSSLTRGQTLVYQAATAPNADLDLALMEVLPAVHRLHTSDPVYPLAHADVPGGRLWLVDIPTHGSRLSSAMVYVALGPVTEQRILFPSVLYGPGASLLMLDQIAHKTYHQLRRYRDHLDPINDAVTALQNTTDALVGERGSPPADDRHLGAVARDIDRLARVASVLNEARISFLKQLHNHDEGVATLGDNPIFAYHRRHLNTAARELALVLDTVRSALDAAGKVVAVGQVQVDKAQGKRQEQIRVAEELAEKAQAVGQQKLQNRLAVLGVALAVPQLIDQRAAAELLRAADQLRWMGWFLPAPTNVSPAPLESGYSAWVLLLIRLLLTALPVGLLAGTLRWRVQHPSAAAAATESPTIET